MYIGKTVFSQLMDFLPMYEFRKCVDLYNGNYHTSSFSCMLIISVKMTVELTDNSFSE
jgi:hypothetical protein